MIETNFDIFCNFQASLEELVQGGPSVASSLTTYDEAALCSSAFR